MTDNCKITIQYLAKQIIELQEEIDLKNKEINEIYDRAMEIGYSKGYAEGYLEAKND